MTNAMRIHTAQLEEETQGFCDIINITPKVQDHVERERFQRGLVSLFVSGGEEARTTTTAGGTTTGFHTSGPQFWVLPCWSLWSLGNCSSGHGSKSCCWILTTARDDVRSLFR